MSEYYNPELDPSKNPEQREYDNMSGKLVWFKTSVFQGMRQAIEGQKQEIQMALLALDMSRYENVMFCNAWLPDFNPVIDPVTGYIVAHNSPEVIIELKGPVYGPCRCYVMRQDERYKWGPYLMVASVGVEQDLKRYAKEDQVLYFKALPASSDNIGDTIHDPEHDHELYNG
jgi:hypothetical protein